MKQKRNLGDVVEIFNNVRVPIKESERTRGMYPYYGASGIVDSVNSYIFDGEYLLISEDGENLRTRKTPIAFLARGKFWANNHVHVVQGNEEANTEFLSYALAATDVSGYLTGSTMPKLTLGNLKRIPLPIPKISIQKAIASVLGTLDQKIELNIDINETLEAMAQEVFNHKFDPAWPRERASSLAINGILLIGDGYRAKNSELGEEGLPFARAANLNKGFDFSTCDRVAAEMASNIGAKCSVIGDVAFTSKGTVGRFAFVGSDVENFVYSPQLCYWRSLNADVVCPEYLYLWMKSKYFLTQLDAVKAQTDMAEYVSLADQRAMWVTVPPSTEHTSMAECLRPIFQKMSHNNSEARTLVQLRDLLLPKLMSGEICVKDAERMVGDVV